MDSLSELIKEHSYGLADYNLDEEHELDILLGTVECSEIMMGKIVRHKGLALQLTKFGYIVTGALRKHAAPGPLSAPAAIISDGEFDAGEPGPTSRLFELVAEDDLNWEQLDTETRIVKFQEEPHLFNVDHRQPCWDCRSDDPNQFMEKKTVRIRPTVRIQVNKETVRTRALLDTGSTVNLISEAAVDYYKLKKIPLEGELKLFHGETLPYTSYVAVNIATGNPLVDMFWTSMGVRDFNITLYAIVVPNITQARRSYQLYYDSLINRFKPRYHCARFAVADSPSQRIKELEHPYGDDVHFILGSNVWANIITSQVMHMRSVKNESMMSMLTYLGFIIMGETPRFNSDTDAEFLNLNPQADNMISLVGEDRPEKSEV